MHFEKSVGNGLDRSDFRYVSEWSRPFPTGVLSKIINWYVSEWF
ncbi:MAG: hypothetical protein RSE24_03135 [Oscillospiraceae bacterium]